MDLNLIKEIRVYGSSINVLYVEDESGVREQVLKLLQKLFHCVDSAVDGVDALVQYRRKHYDLVITDLKMPKMGGTELCTNIISTNKEQHIIVTSAHKESEELLELINIGIMAFVIKPIDITILLKKLYTITRNIYANKMMKYHYDEMKKQISDDLQISEEQELGNIDPLTSLYNYKYFAECIDDPKSSQCAILVSINDLKLMSNYYSSVHKNHLLYQVAHMLKNEAVRYECDIFRISDDEFVLLKKDVECSCESLEREAQHLYKAIEKRRFKIVGVEGVCINVTLGIAQSKTRLTESLHKALFFAKKHGLKHASFQNIPDDTEGLKKIIEVKKMLQNSIEQNLITPVYQPIVMRDESIKYEVLMRMRDERDEGTLLAPALFLEVAKKHSYYNEISQMVIFKALDYLSLRGETLSLNISYADIKNIELMDRIEAIIVSRSLGDKLVFELVESEEIEDTNLVMAFISRFRKYGVKIAIDDFGSGYSNFANLFLFSPDYIKIDGSLVSNMLYNQKVFLFIETIIDFAHKLGIEVIAEFVSSQKLYDALMELRVDGIQGYFVGVPNEKI